MMLYAKISDQKVTDIYVRDYYNNVRIQKHRPMLSEYVKIK